MSNDTPTYDRLSRLLGLMDFTWNATGRAVDRIAAADAWMTRYRPGGPHALWIVGHLAYIESGAFKRYTGAEKNALAHWKDLFDNGSPTVDDATHYPPAAEVQEALTKARKRLREFVAGLSEEGLDEADVIERLPIRDRQSHIEFMLWHDSHHGAQLMGIAAEAESANS